MYEKSQKGGFVTVAELCQFRRKKKRGDGPRYLDVNWVVIMGAYMLPKTLWNTPCNYHGYTMFFSGKIVCFFLVSLHGALAPKPCE